MSDNRKATFIVIGVTLLISGFIIMEGYRNRSIYCMNIEKQLRQHEDGTLKHRALTREFVGLGCTKKY